MLPVPFLVLICRLTCVNCTGIITAVQLPYKDELIAAV